MRKALVALLTILSACGDGYTWERAGPPAPSYTWMVAENETVFLGGCGDPNFIACAYYSEGMDCLVISRLTEEQAKKHMINGRSVFEHEVWDEGKTVGHCAGFRHKEKYVRSV